MATLLHALVLAALMVAPLRRTGERKEVEAPAGAAEITISVEEAVGATRERARDAVEANAGARANTSASASANANANENPRGEIAELGVAAPAGSERAPGTASSGSGIAIPIPYSAAELGIGGPNPFLPRREEKAPTGPDHPAARAMRGTGLEHDRELGLGPEGPAITALTEATTSSIAPLRGRAMFVVRTGGDGVVSAIDLVDSEGGSGWVDAGRIALESLRGKKLRIPSGATGMNMHIEVRSEMKLPNGENAPFGGRRGDNDMPELTIPDVSNIGSKPRRVVHARAAGTELL